MIWNFANLLTTLKEAPDKELLSNPQNTSNIFSHTFFDAQI